MGYLAAFFLFVVTGDAAVKMDFSVGLVQDGWDKSR